MPHSLIQIIEPAIRANPKRIAIADSRGRGVTYEQLESVVDAFAAHASNAGIKKGMRVSLRGLPGASHLFMVFALSKLGAIAMPMPETFAASGSTLTSDMTIEPENPEAAGPNVIRTRSDWTSPVPLLNPSAMSGLDSVDDLAIVMTTSGTTGRKKPLGYSLSLVQQGVIDQSVGTDVSARRTFLSILPTSTFGFEMALLTLRSGGQIVWTDGNDRTTLQLLIEGRADEIIAAPAAYSRWVQALKLADIRLKSVRHAMMAGSLASKDLIRSIQTYICPNLTNNYGSSELGKCAFSNVNEVAEVPNGVAKLVPWIEVRVCDGNGNDVPKGQPGLLQFRMKPGRRMAPYLGMPGNEGHVSEDWFIPGDMGSVTADGILCIEGRATDLINIGGGKIAPSLVEDVVAAFLGEGEPVCAFGVAGPDGFDDVAIALGAHNAERLKDLSVHIDSQNLKLGRVHFVTLENFPVNEFGKIDRLKLREIAAEILAKQA